MPIQFNVANAQTGQTNPYSINESRMARIAGAKTLDEAQRMGIFDRIKDWCSGGVKAEAIRQIFEQVSAPLPHEAEPVAMLHRFERMRAMVVPEHQSALTVTHESGLGPDRSQWGFKFSVGDTDLYHSGPLDDTPDQNQKTFLDHKTMYQGLRETLDYFSGVMKALGSQMNDVGHYIDGRIESMSDDKSVQSFVKDNLQNPLFCKANFQGIEVTKPGTVFNAVFRSPSGEEAVLTLSDRKPSKMEFRAHILKEALATSDFENLQELLASGHMTKSDGGLFMALGSSTGGVMNALGDIFDPQGENPVKSEKDYFERLLQLQPVNNPWLKALSEVKVGEVSLADVCFRESIDDVRIATLADHARTQLDDELNGKILQQVERAKVALTHSQDDLQQAIPGPNDPAFESVLSEHLPIAQWLNLSPEDLMPVLIRLRDGGPAEQTQPFFSALRQAEIGGTNMLEYLMRSQAPPPQALASGLIPWDMRA